MGASGAFAAVSNHVDSPLKAYLSAQIPAGESGFHLLREGRAALAARLALAQRATRTLDVQYYLFHHDATGKLVAAALLAAAERGVRVRVLVDDIDTADKELRLATLNAHPNIQVRLFNPFHTRSTNLFVKGWQALARNVRLNRRMHNKVFIADNHSASPAGQHRREYYDAHHDLAFATSTHCGGAIVDSLSRSFRSYRNSDAAVPAAPAGQCQRIRLQRTTRILQQYRAQQIDRTIAAR